jgi:hypothetical protein
MISYIYIHFPSLFMPGQAPPGKASSAARRARRSFPMEIIPDFSRENLEKNPVNLEKNPVSLRCVAGSRPATPYG